MTGIIAGKTINFKNKFMNRNNGKRVLDCGNQNRKPHLHAHIDGDVNLALASGGDVKMAAGSTRRGISPYIYLLNAIYKAENDLVNAGFRGDMIELCTDDVCSLIHCRRIGDFLTVPELSAALFGNLEAEFFEGDKIPCEDFEAAWYIASTFAAAFLAANEEIIEE